MKRPRCWLASLAVVVVVGCKVGPDYRPAAPPTGAQAPLVSADPAAETPVSPPDDWWRLYDDDRLTGLLEEAFAANRDLAAAEANVSGARAILNAARAGRYPQTKIEGGGIHGRDATTDEILLLGGHNAETVWTLDDVFQVAYEVDLFGRVRRSIEAARASTDAIVAARDSLRVVIAAETARAYADICSLGEQIAVAHHSLDVVSHEAEITVNRHDAGANSEFDVVRAQGLVSQTRSRIPPLEGQRRAATYQLTALLGRTPQQAPDVADCTTPPHLSALLPIGDGAALLKRRPDVRQAERRVAAATAQIGIATADLYPRISLLGFYGGAGFQGSDLIANRGLTWGIGPSISWTFPNQTLPRARIAQAQSSAAAALANFDSSILTALKETEQALALYGSALQRRAELSKAQALAHRGFDMAHAQFLAGSVSNLDLLTTEQFLIAADEAVAASDTVLIQDQIAVFKALGGGWQLARAIR